MVKLLTSKKKLIYIISPIVLIAILVGLFVFVPSLRFWESTTNTEAQDLDRSISAYVDISKKDGKKVEDAIRSKDKDAINTIYDNAAGRTESSEEKTTLSLRRAEAFYRMGDLDAAIKIGLELEKQDGGNISALMMLAGIYKEKGDKASAAKYYRKIAEAMKGLPADGPVYSNTPEEYIKMAEEIEG